MQGTIFDIKRFAIHDGPGLRTTLFFKGCPLQCWWCHNPESINPDIESFTEINKLGDTEIKSEKEVGYLISVDDLVKEVVKDKVFMEEGKGGVTLSGGEPLYQADFAKALLEQFNLEGLHTTVDTSGAVSTKVFQSVLPFVNLFLYDIKLMDSALHWKYTHGKNELIKTNFKYLINTGKHVIARVPVIPGINDGEEEQKQMLSLFLDNKNENFNEIHLLPYHHIGQSKYQRFAKKTMMNKTKEPSKDKMQQISKAFKEAGFKVKIHV